MLNNVQALVAQIQTLLAVTAPSDAAQRALLLSIRDRLEVLTTSFPGNWAAMSAQDQFELQGNLAALLDVLQRVTSDGPTDGASEMHKTFGSNRRVGLLTLWAVLGGAVMIYFIIEQCRQMLAFGMPKEIVEGLPLIATMGALGGFLSCIQSLGRYVGNRQFLRSWTVYYFMFPLKGAGLAMLVFFLIHTDLGENQLNLRGQAVSVITNTTIALNPSKPTTPTTTTPAVTPTQPPTTPPLTQTLLPTGSTNPLTVGSVVGVTNPSTPPTTVVTAPAATPPVVTPSLGTIDLKITADPSGGKKINLVLAALLAGLTGMFANQAIEMLSQVFTVVFKKVDGRDPVRDDRDGTLLPPKPPAN